MSTRSAFYSMGWCGRVNESKESSTLWRWLNKKHDAQHRNQDAESKTQRLRCSPLWPSHTAHGTDKRTTAVGRDTTPPRVTRQRPLTELPRLLLLLVPALRCLLYCMESSATSAMNFCVASDINKSCL